MLLKTNRVATAGGGWLAVLLMAIWIVPGLFGHEPWKPDEGYTIGLVKHVVDTGDWVAPHLAGAPFMEKPPVFFITAALFAKALPEGLLPLHQVMALAAAFYLALMFLFVYFAGRELEGNRAGLVAALGLMGCVGLLVRAHSAITDVALWCGFAVAVYGMVLSPRRNAAGAFWFGTGSGLTFMAKGFLGPAFIGAAVLLLPLVCRESRSRRYLGFLALSLIFSLPWLVVWPYALYERSPDLFFTWLLDNNLGRFLGPQFGYARLAFGDTPWKYLLMFPWFTLPLWPPALVAWWRKGWSGFGRTGMAFPTLVVLVGMALLSAADTRRDLYLIPLLIPLAVVAGQVGGEISAWLDVALRRIPKLIFCLVGVGIWGAWAVWRSGASSALNSAIEKGAPGLSEWVQPPWLAFAGVLTLLCLWILCKSERGRSWDWVWAAGVTLVWGVAMLLFMPALDHVKGYRPTFDAMLRHIPDADAAVIDGMLLGESQRAVLDYYFGVRTRETMPGSESGDANYLLVQNHRSRFMYTPVGDWEMIWDGARPGDDTELYRLYRRRGDGGGR